MRSRAFCNDGKIDVLSTLQIYSAPRTIFLLFTVAFTCGLKLQSKFSLSKMYREPLEGLVQAIKALLLCRILCLIFSATLEDRENGLPMKGQI